MTQEEKLRQYLIETYAYNEPILLSDICIEGVGKGVIKKKVAEMAAAGELRRFDRGIYYFPSASRFSAPSMDEIIEQKYLRDAGGACGYIAGLMFANRVGVTTQVPAVYELCSNKATTNVRRTEICGLRVIIREPYVRVNNENASALQFLDLLKDVDRVSEIQGKPLRERLLAYMKRRGLTVASLEPYFTYYPERIYKNLYETGLLIGAGNELPENT